MKWILVAAIIEGNWLVGGLDPHVDYIKKIAAFDTEAECRTEAAKIDVRGKILTQCIHGYIAE